MSILSIIFPLLTCSDVSTEGKLTPPCDRNPFVRLCNVGLPHGTLPDIKAHYTDCRCNYYNCAAVAFLSSPRLSAIGEKIRQRTPTVAACNNLWSLNLIPQTSPRGEDAALAPFDLVCRRHFIYLQPSHGQSRGLGDSRAVPIAPFFCRKLN